MGRRLSRSDSNRENARVMGCEGPVLDRDAALPPVELVEAGSEPAPQPGAKQSKPARQPAQSDMPSWVGFAKKLSMTFFGLGIIGSLVGAGTLGTYAGFVATVTNPASNFTAGK